MSEIFTGIGFDAHKFGAKKGAWIACLEWPESLTCEGHSDGDVVAHAICDALLSAANLGDLGSNFGRSEPKWAGVSGANLLAEVYKLISAEKFKIQNVSAQLIGNSPKIGPRRDEAIAAISSALNGARVSLSATTTDGMGFTGSGEGLAALATVLIAR
jgi:2-C-methyl-D-erythritol 2,4-cyclodiphosphate synthase